MTRNELLRRFPNASENFIAANLALGSAPSSAKPQRTIRHEPLAKAPRAQENPTRCSVCIVSYRRRLLDPDKLIGTYFVDSIRFGGLISGDTAALLDYSIRQEKVASESLERTEIHITQL